MNCNSTRRMLPLLDQGGLPPRRSEALMRHLDHCSACSLLRSEHEAVLSMLSGYQPPALPEGFTAQLRARLEAEPQRPCGDDTRPLPALDAEPRHLRALRALGLMAAGLVLGALGLWGTMRLTGEASHGTAPVSASLSASLSATASADETGIEATLDLGQVAVVTLVLDALVHHPDAVLELVLPDGLSLVGEGLLTLEEKALRWTESLKPGENLIRVPVRAQRSGVWTLVARARSGENELTGTARLKVNRS